MIVTCVHVFVKPEHVEDFIAASKRNHENSVQEPGNRRFDVLQSTEDPTRFLLYEAYDDAASAAAHKGTEHYRVWRDTVASWMAKPREGVPYAGIAP